MVTWAAASLSAEIVFQFPVMFVLICNKKKEKRKVIRSQIIVAEYE